MKILIADDDYTSRVVLKTVLEKNGFDIIEAENGVQALGILRGESSPQLAVLDWMMPDMDGIDVIRKIREGKSSAYKYIILLTTKHMEAAVWKAFPLK